MYRKLTIRVDDAIFYELSFHADELKDSEAFKQALCDCEPGDDFVVEFENVLSEFEVAHQEALELNEKCVYVEGHGTRAYELVEVALDGFYARALSLGTFWFLDKETFTKVRPS